MKKSLLNLFPKDMVSIFAICEIHQDKIQEIRLRVGQPILIYEGDKEYTVTGSGQMTSILKEGKCIDEKEIHRILSHLCQYSVYAFENQIGSGFLTVFDGHRIGICGQTVIENGKVKTIKNVQAMNMRIAHEILGVADKVLPWIYEKDRVKNTLLIGRPACGKTTLLRDMIRQISNGNSFGKGLNVGVVDERSELGACYMGQPQNDLGIRTDVLDGCLKGIGLSMLIRTMAPEVLAVDELGSDSEISILKSASESGCSILASIHGGDIGDVKREILLMFDRYLVLEKKNGKCVVQSIWKREEKNGETIGIFDDTGRQYRDGIFLPLETL